MARIRISRLSTSRNASEAKTSAAAFICRTMYNEAMDYFYNSKTFKDLLNPESKLFIQSPVYIFDTLETQG